MALIKCKECGKEISDLAASCPHCGAPVNTTPAPAQQQQINYQQQAMAQQKSQQKSMLKTMLFSTLISSAISVITSLIYRRRF